MNIFAVADREPILTVCLAVAVAELLGVAGHPSLSTIARQVRLLAKHDPIGADPEFSVWMPQGSGSACRSLMGGFVRWQMGQKEDGTDSGAVQVVDDPISV